MRLKREGLYQVKPPDNPYDTDVEFIDKVVDRQQGRPNSRRPAQSSEREQNIETRVTIHVYNEDCGEHMEFVVPTGLERRLSATRGRTEQLTVNYYILESVLSGLRANDEFAWRRFFGFFGYFGYFGSIGFLKSLHSSICAALMRYHVHAYNDNCDIHFTAHRRMFMWVTISKSSMNQPLYYRNANVDLGTGHQYDE